MGNFQYVEVRDHDRHVGLFEQILELFGVVWCGVLDLFFGVLDGGC